MKIKNKNILITIDNGYYTGPSVIKYIESGLKRGFTNGSLKSKTNKNQIGFWKIAEYNSKWEELYINNQY